MQRYTLCTMCEDSSCVEMGLSIARRLRTPRCISALSRDSVHSRDCLRAVRVSSTTPDGKAMKIFNSDIAFNLSKENDSSLNSGVNGEVRVTSRVYALIHSEMWLSALKWLLTEICITPYFIFTEKALLFLCKSIKFLSHGHFCKSLLLFLNHFLSLSLTL